MLYQTDFAHRIKTEKFQDYWFDIGLMGPPSEQGSLLLRVTRNCPWNRCFFCTSYKDKKFEYKNVKEIKRDVDIVKALEDEIIAACCEFGYGNELSDDWLRGVIVNGVIQGNPEIYRRFLDSETLHSRLASLYHVAYWLGFGSKTVFLGDANSLIMRTPELIEVLRYLKERFPTIERITSYARAKTCAKKSVEELKELHEAGLSRLHVGLESGHNEVLKYMQKGVTAEEHIRGGKNIVESGISLSEYVMPGLGGRKWSKEHVLETAKAINEINPDFIRIRSLAVLKDSPLYEKCKAGEFEQLTEDELVEEIGVFIECLNCDSYVVSDQMTNLLWDIEGQLPQDKARILGLIEQYKTKSPIERLRFQLNQYSGPYCDYLSRRGKLDWQLHQLIKEARESTKKKSSDSEAKVEQAILAIKERGIP